MTDDRWEALMRDKSLNLTPDEVDAGWHFCLKNKGVLLGPGMMGFIGCGCDAVESSWSGRVTTCCDSVTDCDRNADSVTTCDMTTSPYCVGQTKRTGYRSLGRLEKWEISAAANCRSLGWSLYQTAEAIKATPCAVKFIEKYHGVDCPVKYTWKGKPKITMEF